MENKMQKILIVDDHPENLLVLEKILGDKGEIIRATSGNEALGLTLEHDFAIVLMDVQMPEMDGFETAELIRGNQGTENLPIIFITAISQSSQHIFKGYESGAVDFLFKPFESYLLRAKVEVFLQLHRQRLELIATAAALHDALKELHKSHEMVEQKNKELRHLSIRDGLTGLFNHRHLQNVLEDEFYRARRYGRDLCCLLMDLDFFKKVNDTFGHGVGDQVLREFSEILKLNIRDSDQAFRYGGEEFLILLPQTSILGGKEASEKIRMICNAKRYKVGDQEIKVSVSIGVASICSHNPEDASELINFADSALYTVKSAGRNMVKVYDPTT